MKTGTWHNLYPITANNTHYDVFPFEIPRRIPPTLAQFGSLQTPLPVFRANHFSTDQWASARGMNQNTMQHVASSKFP